MLRWQSVLPDLLSSKNQKHAMVGFFEFSTFRKQLAPLIWTAARNGRDIRPQMHLPQVLQSSKIQT